MIAKIRRGSDFRGLQLYLLSELKGVPPEDVELRALVSADTAADEMRLVAGRSKRIERAVYHIILAWAEDEQPSRDQQFAAGHELLDRIGLGAHQALLARHTEPKAGSVPGEGRHFELHLMINRVGPDGRVLAMRNDYATVERAVAAIAAAQSMRVVPGRHNGQEGFVQGSSEKARSVAAATGRTSLAMDVRAMPDVMSDLLEARAHGWPSLIEAFARHGIRLCESNRTGKKGQSAGLVMTMIANPDRSEKLSGLDSPSVKWGRPTLERQLGAFPVTAAETIQAAVRAPTTVQPTQRPDETRRIFEETRAAVLLERKRLGELHKKAKTQLVKAHAQERKKLVTSASRRRSCIRVFFGRTSKVGPALNLVLDDKSKLRLAELRAGHQQDTQKLIDDYTKTLARVPVPTWTDWQRKRDEKDHRSTPQKGEMGTETERDDKPSRARPPSATAADSVAASIAMTLDDHEQRRERLARNRDRKAALRRGDLDARVAAIADDLCVAAAAQIIRHFRSKRALRTTVLIITALASGSAIAPVVLAAAAVALLRRSEIGNERASLRADINETRAARTGWAFADVTTADRARYAALTRSDIIDPAGPDAGPIIAAVGRESAARFVSWWAYASPEQREVVAAWDKPRKPRQPARARSSKQGGSRGRG